MNSETAITRKVRTIGLFALVFFMLALLAFIVMRPTDDNKGNDEAVPPSACWGFLSASDPIYRLLESSGDIEHEESSLKRANSSATCVVSGKSGPKESFEFRIGGVSGEWPYSGKAGVVSLGQYKHWEPMGNGINGWTQNRRADVRLPDECRGKLGSAEAPAVVSATLDLADRPVGDNEAIRASLRDTVVSVAQRAARANGCASPDLNGRTADAAESVNREAQIDRTCGIPGLDLLDASSVGQVRETIKSDEFRMWSCLLTAEGDNGLDVPLAALTVTTHRQLVKEFSTLSSFRAPVVDSWKVPGVFDGSFAILADCGENNALIYMEGPNDLTRAFDEAARLSSEYLEIGEQSFAQFASSVSSELKCSAVR